MCCVFGFYKLSKHRKCVFVAPKLRELPPYCLTTGKVFKSRPKVDIFLYGTSFPRRPYGARGGVCGRLVEEGSIIRTDGTVEGTTANGAGREGKRGSEQLLLNEETTVSILRSLD